MARKLMGYGKMVNSLKIDNKYSAISYINIIMEKLIFFKVQNITLMAVEKIQLNYNLGRHRINFNYYYMDKKTKFYTLMFLINEGKILLGMKKRGFGAGKYNGFGGKVEAGETIAQAAVRETIEECGLKPLDAALQGRH